MFLFVLAVAIGNVVIGFAIGLWIHDIPFSVDRALSLFGVVLNKRARFGISFVGRSNHGEQHTQVPSASRSRDSKCHHPRTASTNDGGVMRHGAPRAKEDRLERKEASPKKVAPAASSETPQSDAAPLARSTHGAEENFGDELKRLDYLLGQGHWDQDKKHLVRVITNLHLLLQSRLVKWSHEINQDQPPLESSRFDCLGQMIAQAESTLQNLERIREIEELDEVVTSIRQELTNLRSANALLV